MADEERIRELADKRCQAKHIDYYESLICVGASSPEPPCFGCVAEVRQELSDKRQKAHGTLLTPEEAEAIRREMLDE